MQNLTQYLTRWSAAEPESMDQLRGDCARMAPDWSGPVFPALSPSPALSAPPPGKPGAPASYEALRGVRVPAASARLLEGMSEYGVW
ncbi:MAG TPA: hypothetical protein VGO89_07810 [Streptomyces sp.]|jgi:hypothetical protein|nr:hypothetical protein [Streptomyces sp.]